VAALILSLGHAVGTVVTAPDEMVAVIAFGAVIPVAFSVVVAALI
jgi:hypothetical protein